MSEDVAARIDQLLDPAGAGERLIRLYREIGLAAIACELDIDLADIDAALEAPAKTGRDELAA